MSLLERKLIGFQLDLDDQVDDPELFDGLFWDHMESNVMDTDSSSMKS